MKTQSSEKGQALVLIILAIVAIFGFAALAVDGGRIYSERRRAQAAVDSAALAAAYAAADGKVFSQVKATALNLAAQNGFANNAQDVANNVPYIDRDVVVEYFNPPQSGPYKDNPQYHQVRITEKVDPIFSQLLFQGDSRITVEAVTFSTVNCNCFAPGNAIHATNSTLDKALEFDGSVDVTVNRGNIFSNSNSSSSGVKHGGSGKIKVINGKIWVVGGWSGKTNTSPTPIEGAPFSSLPNLPVPACENAFPGSKSSSGKDGTLSPGKFADGIDINGGDWVMEPGIYCIYDGFTINGNATLSGSDVFIAMMSGELKLNGNGEVNLTRANSLQDSMGNEWGGMLIYAPPSNHSGISLSGTNDTSYSGTVYAPGSECKVGGNNVTIGLRANLICDTIKIHGNATVAIDFIDEQNYQLPKMIELTQ